jgi:diguanylate cyclase (GGDEF)-like protein
LSILAQLKANRLAKYIYTNGEHWRYQTVRLAELIEIPEADEKESRQRLFGPGRDLVLETGEELRFPVAMQTAPIIVGGRPVGMIETAATLRPTLVQTAIVGLFSGLFGSLMYFALRVLPLRALDRALAALDAQTLRLESALQNMTQGLCMFDAEGRLVVANARFSNLFGILPAAVLPGTTESELMWLAETGAEGTKVTTDEAGLLHRANGNVISTFRETMSNGGEVVTYEDVTQRREAEAKIAHMARHDALTDLPNRLLFSEKLTEAVHGLKDGEDLAVLCLDIDSFKAVNDTLGHSVGDELLKAVAQRLCAAVRETDVVARLGGDEFAVVQTMLAQPDDATTLAVRLVQTIASPFEINGHQLIVGTSVGIAMAPGDGIDPNDLLRNADMALYRAKADGKGTYRYFEAEMDARMQRRRALEIDLRKATAMGEFELFYQPIVDINTEALLGCEALLRWNHPLRGLVQPNDFIPLAEETGQIVVIGEWAIRQACMEAAGWPGFLKIAVNLSPVQFKSSNLVPAVRAALASSGLGSNRLELEITESVLLNENEKTLSILHQLRAMGVRIAMDDFGTGYSSLSYLRKFPFDKIKIDRSFINEMSDRDDSLAIIRAVSAIGASLGMLTTAEGVETREQFERLKLEGCTEAQGYLFSAPLPAAEVARLVALGKPDGFVAMRDRVVADGESNRAAAFR